jgi:hypothetical protein
MEEKEKTIYQLKLHEELTLNRSISVLRVPGGWIYRFDNRDTNYVFVPFDNGFEIVTNH